MLRSRMQKMLPFVTIPYSNLLISTIVGAMSIENPTRADTNIISKPIGPYIVEH
jgi:hypothetical protein